MVVVRKEVWKEGGEGGMKTEEGKKGKKEGKRRNEGRIKGANGRKSREEGWKENVCETEHATVGLLGSFASIPQ